MTLSIIQVVGIGIVGALIAILLKEYKPIFSVSVGMITLTIILFSLLSEINYIIDAIHTISSQLNIKTDYINTIIKTIGISYLCRFGTEICKDSGQGAIAQYIEVAGKIIIVVISMPILTSVINVLIGILP